MKMPKSKRKSRLGTTSRPPSTPSIFSNFECVQLSVLERLYLHAAKMGDLVLLNEILEKRGNENFNWNCVDYMGRNSLHLAVESENMDMIEILMEHLSFEGMEEGMLHAISKGQLNIVEMIMDNPKYYSEEARYLKIFGKRDPFFRKEEKYQYPPEITPLILAAHHNDHEIIQLFISRGYKIERPHPIHCRCQDCRYKQHCDSLKRSRSRFNAYKALASPAYLALSSSDPINQSFALRRELIQIAHAETEFKRDYMKLADQCMEFACRAMNLCTGTQEMEAILGLSTNSKDPLDRLREAVQNEEKLFLAHPNTQQHLTNIWYGKEMQFLQGLAMWKKVIMQLLCPLITPFCALIYILFPNSKVGRIMRCPVTKFMTHTASHLTFLLLLAFVTFEVNKFYSDVSGETHEQNYTLEDNYTYSFSNETIEKYLRETFRPAGSTFASLFTVTQCLIGVWLIGKLFLECKQVYGLGMLEHFQQYYNIMDFLTISFYVAAYSMKLSTFYKLSQAEEKLHYVRDAESALREGNFTKFKHFRTLSKQLVLDTENNYFMAPSRFQWEMSDPEIVSNVLFAMANILSFARTTYMMPSHELLGPLQITLERMLGDIIRFTVLFILVLVAFMVGMTNLYTYYGHEDAKVLKESAFTDKFRPIKSFESLSQTVTTLFFSIFGLITLDKMYIQLPDLNNTYINKDSTMLIDSIGVLLFGVFQILATLVLVNMLIAMMSHSFNIIQGDTDVEWKFARTKLWLNFIDERSTLPVPFNMIPTIHCFKYLFYWCRNTCKKCGDAELPRWRKREHKALVSTPKSSNPFQKAPYTDIMHRIMRRYLFEMDRDKRKPEKKEGTVGAAVPELEETQADPDQVFEEQTTSSFEEERTPKSSLVATHDTFKTSPRRLRRRSDLETQIIRSAKAKVDRAARISVKSSTTVSSMQFDAIKRGQRLLDARMQEILDKRARHEAEDQNMILILQKFEQSQQNMTRMLELLRNISQRMTVLGESFFSFVGYTVDQSKEKEKQSQSGQSQETSQTLTKRVAARAQAAKNYMSLAGEATSRTFRKSAPKLASPPEKPKSP